VRPGNYAEQARTYDLTRGASPTVVRLVSKFLGPAVGRRLLDIAGGTGNYAQAWQARGFEVTIVDAEPAMLERSVPKVGGGRQVIADALTLPFPDGSFDCATIMTALHLMADQGRALREARRILRGGPLAILGFTQENLGTLFVLDYFPVAKEWPPENPGRDEMVKSLYEAGFGRVEWETFVYLDSVDGTLPALHSDPLRLAGPAYLRNTSFFQRLPDDARREGLARLAEDLRSGVLERRVREAFGKAVEEGHGTVFAAWPEGGPGGVARV
jgi:SAM-dependent methyltransferase